MVRIDEKLCNGCGLCVPNCHEGALQIIDNKAVLISDLMCDGLGACIGHCPEGAITIERREAEPYDETDESSALTQWPVQMHLINPAAPYFRNCDLLVAADCTAFSMGAFHNRFIKGKSIVIACPKLDHGTDTYIEKLTSLIDDARANRITVVIMEVPCCAGLLRMVQQATSTASRKVPVKLVVAGIRGEIMKEEWV